MKFIEEIAKNENAVKVIFDNVRNIGLCALILGAGLYKPKYLEADWHFFFDEVIRYGLIVAGGILFLINYEHALRKIKELPYPKIIFAFFGCLYGLLAVRVVLSLLSSRL
jgi:hypothetical protein